MTLISYGSFKAENDSPDWPTSRMVMEANRRKTREWVRNSALHDAHYEGPQNRAAENDTGSLSQRGSRSHCGCVLWRQRHASGVVPQSRVLSGSRSLGERRAPAASVTQGFSRTEKTYLATISKDVSQLRRLSTTNESRNTITTTIRPGRSLLILLPACWPWSTMDC